MKRLIFCADGTWRRADKGEQTNVARVAQAIHQTSGSTEQLVEYDEGVGTEPWDRIRGGVFGIGLGRNVQDGYRFFAGKYEPGDELYLFGFSRGAYTVRSLVGMIRNSGLLRQEQVNGVNLKKAYDLYRDTKIHPDDVEAVDFREQHSHQPSIRFLGVWDTVGSLGVPTQGTVRDLVRIFPVVGRWYRARFEFHDAALSGIVDNAMHAVSIDERRPGFDPTLWTAKPVRDDQQVEQVWFAGVHSDVGGGYRDCRLADVTLCWMIEKAGDAGLDFDATWITQHLRPDWNGRAHNSLSRFFKLAIRANIFGSATRRVSTEEALARSVDRRLSNGSPRYAPANVADYSERRVRGGLSPREIFDIGHCADDPT